MTVDVFNDCGQTRAIGEDGLPVPNQPLDADKPAAPLRCVIYGESKGFGPCDVCGAPATQAWYSSKGSGVVTYHRCCDEHGCDSPSEAKATLERRKCGICNDVATNWIQLCGWKAYLCDQHEAWGSYFRDGCVFCVPKEEGS